MNNRTPALVGVLFVILLIVAALVYKFVVDRHQDVSHQTQPPAVVLPAAPGISHQPASGAASPMGTTGVIYTVSVNGGGDDNNLVAHPVSWENSQNPVRESLMALIGSDHSPLPKSTALRGIKIVDGLATVDFTQEFQTNFHGGETEEAQAVNSILRTLGQFPNVERVQILVEGKPIDALSQLTISGPLNVIRPDPVRQARSASGTGHG